MLRQRRSGMRKGFNESAFGLVTDASRRIPDKTGSNDYFPMISTKSWDFTAVGNALPPLSGRKATCQYGPIKFGSGFLYPHL